jgi:L-lactate dehydrogenase complex protein LldF
MPVTFPDYDFDAATHAAAADLPQQAKVIKNVLRQHVSRQAAVAGIGGDALRQKARRIKDECLANLDTYLEQMARNVELAGGQVHWAADAAQANDIILEICRRVGARTVIKSKTMTSEETHLNHFLEHHGVQPIETDLGEYIVQMAGQVPSHLVAPCAHLSKEDIGRIFENALGIPYTSDPRSLAEVARVRLREKYRTADVGLSGANFGIAQTGSIVLFTNEGNARMCTTWPKVHIALMGMEKLIPRMEDLTHFIRLLPGAATGQPITVYVNIITGPRARGELDGPQEFHLVVLDNGRSGILGSAYRDALRCIRCGACMNACPVYRHLGGGHAYGSVYPGPIGTVLTPLLDGMEKRKELPHATSLCGACFDACPVQINMPEMFISMRADQVRAGLAGWFERLLYRAAAWGLKRSWTYRFGAWLARWAGRRIAEDGWIRSVPPPFAGWTNHRDMPAPAGKTFRQMWSQALKDER